jgi:hypothetical protein
MSVYHSAVPHWDIPSWMTVSSVSSQHIYWDGGSYLSYILIRTCLDSVCLFGSFLNWHLSSVPCASLWWFLSPAEFRASTLIPVVVSPIVPCPLGGICGYIPFIPPQESILAPTLYTGSCKSYFPGFLGRTCGYIPFSPQPELLVFYLIVGSRKS